MTTPTNTKSQDILRVSTKNQVEFDLLKSDIESLKAWAQSKTGKKIDTDRDFFLFAIDFLKKESNGLTRNEATKGKIIDTIKKQLEINKNDNENMMLAGKIVHYNKRRITPSWLQSELGCSFNPIREWFDNSENTAMLEKHHAACKITENHNRLIAKALKSLAKNPQNNDNEVD